MQSVTLGSEPVMRSRMLSNGIWAPSELHCSQDSISFSDSRKVAVENDVVSFWSGIKDIVRHCERILAFRDCSLTSEHYLSDIRRYVHKTAISTDGEVGEQP